MFNVIKIIQIYFGWTSPHHTNFFLFFSFTVKQISILKFYLQQNSQILCILQIFSHLNSSPISQLLHLHFRAVIVTSFLANKSKNMHPLSICAPYNYPSLIYSTLDKNIHFFPCVSLNISYTENCNSNVIPGLNLCLCHENLWGSGWRCVVIFTPPTALPQYPLYRRVGGPQCQSGHYGEEENLLPLLGTEPHSLVIQPTA